MNTQINNNNKIIEGISKMDKVKLHQHKIETLHRLVEDIEGFLKDGDKNILEWDWDVCMDGLNPQFKIEYLTQNPTLTITLENK